MANINISYIKSLPGLLKLGEILLQVILIICLGVSTFTYGGIGFAWFTVIVSLIWVAVSLAFYLIGFYDNYPMAFWALLKLIITAVWCLFHFISGVICAKVASDLSRFSNTSWGYVPGGLGAAAFFHFVSMAVFGVDAFFYFIGFRNGESSNNNAKPTQPAN